MYSDDDDPHGAGFPHSEIRGSKFARNSPRLIATCYVLHRLSMPRHPPNALITLDSAKFVTCREKNHSLHLTITQQYQTTNHILHSRKLAPSQLDASPHKRFIFASYSQCQRTKNYIKNLEFKNLNLVKVT
jgi:hypothetical protein